MKNPPSIRFEIYQDAQGEWRWRAIRRNGRIVADGGEGYRRRAGALTAATRVVDAIRNLDLMHKKWLNVVSD